MRLLILSHTPHYVKGGVTVGWGSTVREIDQLAKLFDEVVHLAPRYPGEAPGSSLAYTRDNIRFVGVPPAGGDNVGDKLGILGRIPGWLRAMKVEMQRADALHIRCPAGISLVGLLAARWWGRGKPLWVKYAGNWRPDHEPFSYALQRWWLRRNLHRGAVTVNGSWADQQKHVFTFINPSYSFEEYQTAKIIGIGKTLLSPVQILFVGRVEQAKGVGRVLEIASELNRMGFLYRLIIVGDGQERDKYEELVHHQGLENNVMFAGWINKDELQEYYQQSHFILHPSTASEGWPKVLSEAMAYGVVPIASTVSSIPEILGQTGAGLALPQEDTGAYVDAILQYTQDINRWKQASLNGISAGALFTYEHYLQDVQALFRRQWQIELTDEQT